MGCNRALSRLATLLLLLGLAAALGPTSAQAQAPATEVVPLADDVYAFLGSGYVSMFITTDEGVIVVDPIGGGNNRANPDALKAAIADVTDQPVRYLVYSHSAEDHGAGGDVFADTAEFVGHRNTATGLAARDDPRMPVPTILFDDRLVLNLGGKSVELRWAGFGPGDTYITVHYRNVLMAVDNLPIRSLAFADLPTASAEGFIEFIERLEAGPAWDIFVYGHGSAGAILGTRDDARQYREYLQDLLAAVRAAREASLVDNSDEMVAAVRASLEPRYGTWRGFPGGLAANVRGVIRWWSQ